MDDLLKRYPSMDIGELTGENDEHPQVMLSNNGRLEEAEEWCSDMFGAQGADNWWVAPALVLKDGLKDPDTGLCGIGELVQKYKFIFNNTDYATQFKLMGF
jgi:hypothetical protein